MPSWKKVIVSGSDANLNSLEVNNNIIASSFTGSLDGTSSLALNSVLLNSTGSATFATTGSNVFIGTQVITGSVQLSAGSFVGNVTGSLSGSSISSLTASLALSVSGSSGRVLYNSADNTTTTSENLEFDGSNLTVGGQLNASTKSFVIKHRTLPDKKLVYGVSEGPEHSVFIRGKLEGTNKIILPSEWDWLVDLDSLSVQLTPIGKYQKLYVESVEGLVITIANDNLLSKSINCYYLIQGTRKDVEPLQTVI
jgi:hypothetical protein